MPPFPPIIFGVGSLTSIFLGLVTNAFAPLTVASPAVLAPDVTFLAASPDRIAPANPLTPAIPPLTPAPSNPAPGINKDASNNAVP